MNKDINDYLDYLKYERKMSNNTYLSYKYNLEKFFLFFKDSDLKKLSSDDIRNFLYTDEVKARTRAHYLTVINSFYSFLLDNKKIDKNPCDIIKLPRLEKKLPEYLTIEEVDKLLNISLIKPFDFRNIAMLEVLYGSGLRVSEMTNLKISDIDFNECILTIMGKGSKMRIVPMNNREITSLKTYIDEHRNFLLKNNTSEYVFINNAGKKISRVGFFKILKKICDDNGIKKSVSPHTLRHSFATHLLNHGADIRVIQELLGHSNLTTTQIYSHISNDKIKNDYNNHPRGDL